MSLEQYLNESDLAQVSNIDFQSDELADVLVSRSIKARGENNVEDAYSLLRIAESLAEQETHYITAIIAEERAIIPNYIFNKTHNPLETLKGALSSIDDALINYAMAKSQSNKELKSKDEITHRINRAIGIKSVIYKNLASITNNAEEKSLYLVQAEEFAKQEVTAREINEEVTGAMQNAYHSLAEVYMVAGNFKEAENYIMKAKAVRVDEKTDEVSRFLDYRLAVNLYNEDSTNPQIQEYIKNLLTNKTPLRLSLVKSIMDGVGGPDLYEMADEFLVPQIKLFYSVLDK